MKKEIIIKKGALCTFDKVLSYINFHNQPVFIEPQDTAGVRDMMHRAEDICIREGKSPSLGMVYLLDRIFYSDYPSFYIIWNKDGKREIYIRGGLSREGQYPLFDTLCQFANKDFPWSIEDMNEFLKENDLIVEYELTEQEKALEYVRPPQKPISEKIPDGFLLFKKVV